jgi:hypothetical protein
MKISIRDDKKIGELGEEFNQFFPFLKLDFYGGGSEFIPAYSVKTSHVNEKTVREFRKMHTEGEIILFPEMSVSDLETIFSESFGLSVHVLRRAGNSWLETSHSDSWSLEEQNRQGMVISDHLNKQESERKKF